MENHIQSILTKIRSKYLNISTRQLNQCPFHLKKVATLELVSTERGKGTEHVKRDEIHLVQVNYYDLFKWHNELKKLVILIEGEAGIGKTILCSLIIDDWASGRHFDRFFIALLLPLDQINLASLSSLVDLFSVLYDFNDDTSSCLVKYLRDHPNNILIIIDGWDQCSATDCEQTSFMKSLLFGNLFPKKSSITLIITSRPDHRPRFDRLIFIKGFSTESVRNCVISEFDSDAEKIKCISEQLENNALVQSMCRVPLNLALILNICQSCELLPVTMTELYTVFVWGLTRLSIESSGKYEHTDSFLCYDDLPRELQQSWWSLCELAFKNIKCYTSAFSQAEAAKFLSSELKAVSYFGALKPSSVYDKEDGVAFCFLHPVIEEYLAAQHLAKQPLTTELIEECVRMSHLSTCFWKFFLAIYVNETLYVDKGIISHSIQLLSKMDHYSDRQSLILCHYSFEAKNKIVNHVVINILYSIENFNGVASESGVPTLDFGQPRNAYDCMAVMYVIRNMEHTCSFEINFQNCSLAEAQILELGEIVGSKNGKIQVTGLNLSENRLSDSMMINFVDHVAAAFLSLKKLYLRNCGIGERSVRAFLESLAKSSPTLMQLDLSFNPLSTPLLEILQDSVVSGTLVKLEILFLKGSLPFHLDINMHHLVDFCDALVTHCVSFKRFDLSGNDLGKPGNPDLKKIISQFFSHRRNFDLCLNSQYMSEIENNFASIMEDSIKTKGTIDHTIAHLVIVGPGRSGKNTLMNRLMGEGPPDPDYVSPSTGVLESVIKVEVKKLCTIAAAVSSLKWHRLEYDEEALELMMSTAKYHTVSSGITNPISVKYIVRDQSSRTDCSSLTHTTNANPNPIMNKCISEASISGSTNNGCESRNEETSTTKRDVVVHSANIAPVELFKRAVECRRMDAIREQLESSWSLYLTNTGGQIEFQELLPLLVCGPSIFFITFPLHHDLQKPYVVQYQHSSGHMKTYQSTTTLMEELLQILATICALDCTKDQHNVKCVPKVFFIGTHKDCLPDSSAEQIINKIDKQLQAHVKNTALFHQSSIQFSQTQPPLDQMIFTVSNLSKYDQDFQRIRLAVQQTVERKEQFTVTCPSSWLVFSLILRAKHNSIQALHFDDCFNIAHECGISDRKELSAALSFIHSRLGLVRYFNTCELNQYVIIDPQILFDKITYLITKTFTSDNAEVNEIHDFHQRGVFLEEIVHKISERCGSDLHLPSVWLTKLLNYLRIAALFTDRDNKKKYFFPAALCHAPEVCPQHASASMNSPQPLLVAFKGGFCPRGIPGALIKYLMTNEMKSKHPWELLLGKIFRNQVSFRIGVYYGTVTLKIVPTHLEVCIDTKEDCTDDDFRDICKEVYVQIKKGIHVVTDQYFDCIPFLGFYCTLASCKSHPHPARLKRRGKNSMLICTLDQSMQVRLPVAKGYEFWIMKKDSVALEKVIDSDNDGVPKHLGQIAEFMSEWEGKISDCLELTEADVADIRTRYPSELKLQSKAALILWKQKHGSNATYSALITVFEDAGSRQYADKVREIVQVVQNQDSDTDDSGSDEDPFPLTQPQTYPNLETPPPVVLPSPKPLLCESYLFVEPENLPEGCIPSHDDLGSCNVTFVPELSSNSKLSRPSSPKEYLEPPDAKKSKLTSEEENLQRDVTTGGGFRGVEGGGEKQEGSEDREYIARLFYQRLTIYSYEIHLVVTWNIETCLTVVKQEYSGALPGPSQPIDFESDQIELDIPVEGVSVQGGWRITPLTAPVITKRHVDNYKPGKSIPRCQLVAQCEHNSSEAIPVPFYFQVNLLGARKPHNKYTIVSPHICSSTTEPLRLTFPVQDGVIIDPFQLEHGKVISYKVFILKESFHKMLVDRNDLELQFSCYKHNDKQEVCNWPTGVSVSINEKKLQIDRGGSKHSHKTLYLKHGCIQGQNWLGIYVTSCCCSHVFVLQLVHRPSLNSVLRGLLRKRLLPTEHCIAKIKKWFLSNSDDSVQQTGVKVSLKCPITFKKIKLPARGAECRHIQCFDLEAYLQMNCDRGTWKCPVCSSNAQMHGLEIDQYIWSVLNGVSERGSDVDEIIIYPSAKWTPVDKPKDSGKDDEADNPPQKKVKLDTSASGTPSTAAGGTGGSVGTPRGAVASSGGGAGGSGNSATGAAAGTSRTAGDSTAAMQQKTGAAAANSNGVPLSQNHAPGTPPASMATGMATSNHPVGYRTLPSQQQQYSSVPGHPAGAGAPQQPGGTHQ